MAISWDWVGHGNDIQLNLKCDWWLHVLGHDGEMTSMCSRSTWKEDMWLWTYPAPFHSHLMDVLEVLWMGLPFRLTIDQGMDTADMVALGRLCWFRNQLVITIFSNEMCWKAVVSNIASDAALWLNNNLSECPPQATNHSFIAFNKEPCWLDFVVSIQLCHASQDRAGSMLWCMTCVWNGHSIPAYKDRHQLKC
jgi:hypothetical protein